MSTITLISLSGILDSSDLDFDFPDGGGEVWVETGGGFGEGLGEGFEEEGRNQGREQERNRGRTCGA